jgi:2-succinyl-6-hydroxy-2,4-cyclohexadiene-1-carboxylate synthase
MNMLRHVVSSDARGPAILFLHGFMGSAADWWGVRAALDGSHRCLAVDLPGHGASLDLPHPEAYTAGGAALGLLDLLDELNIERPVVVGYSMGGRLALYLALRHPERCAGLFLESASPGIEDPAERRARREADEEKARRLESGDFETFLADWYRQPLFASLVRREGLVEKIVEARRGNVPGELARSLRGMGTGSQPPLWDELAGLQVPTLAVTGELDEKYVGLASRMATLGLRLRTVVVPGVGHSIRVEKPTAYLRLLKDFLDSP